MDIFPPCNSITFTTESSLSPWQVTDVSVDVEDLETGARASLHLPFWLDWWVIKNI